MTARLSIFTGKGGVGKTTAACAFALARARAGERVLLVSLGAPDDVRGRFHAEGDLPDTLEFATVDPRSLVDDIVRALFKLGPMTEAILRQPAYESLVDVTPGLKEMALFHHVHTLRGKGYDRIVLDGPATGHGIHFLEAPEKTVGLLVGQLRERALEIKAALEDPAVTEIIIVTLPEETPVRETMELAEALRMHDFPLDNVIVNRWLPPVFDDAESAGVLIRFAENRDARKELGRAIAHRTRIDVEGWFAALMLVASQREEALKHHAEVQKIGAKISLVPYLPDAEGRLARFAESLHEEVKA